MILHLFPDDVIDALVDVTASGTFARVPNSHIRLAPPIACTAWHLDSTSFNQSARLGG